MIYNKFALTILTIMVMSNVLAKTSDTTETFSGINLTNGDESVLIPVKEKMTVKTNTSKYKGILDSVNHDHLFINGNAIIKSQIEMIKFIPAEKSKLKNAFLLSAPSSFAGVIGFALWYYGIGGEWTGYQATALLIYTPIGLVTGVILSKKQKFRLKGEWSLTILEQA